MIYDLNCLFRFCNSRKVRKVSDNFMFQIEMAIERQTLRIAALGFIYPITSSQYDEYDKTRKDMKNGNLC